VFDNGTNVGIGTTSPSAKLQVQGSTNITGDLFIGTAQTYGYIYGPSSQIFGSVGANTTWINAGTSGLRFNNAADNTTLMFMSNAGNVGIGTTSVPVKLMVAGTIRANGVDGQIDADSSVGAFRFYNGSTFRGGFGTDEWATGGDAGNLITYINGGNYFIYSTTTNSKIFTALSGGNIGIGTTSPSVKLHIYNNVNDGHYTLNQNISSGTSAWSGFVSRNNNNGYLYLQTVGSNFTGADYGNHALVGQQGMATLAIYSDTDLRFRTGGTVASNEKMRVTSGGNVGIGTTSPSSRLHVTGSTDTVKFEGSGSNIFTVDGTSGRLFSVDDDLTNSLFSVNTIAGLPVIEAFADNTVRLGKYTAGVGVMNITGSYVGIGTSVPAAALHVVGNQYTSKASGGGHYKQVVVGQIGAAPSGTAKKIAYVGFTHSVRVYVWANQSTAHGSSAIADICTLYGSSNGGTTVEANFGNVTDIVIAYNNGGSPAYTIDVTLTYSGAAPTINYVIEGISWDNNIYTL
jgi:hypothetical protein